MTKLERAKKLEAEAKALRRQEKQFWAEIDKRQGEIKKHLGMSDMFVKICQAYNATTQTEAQALYEFLTSDRQVTYYRKHKEAAGV